VSGVDVGAEATILLVDDRRQNLVALEAVLAPLGHRLLMASSGEEALKHLLVEEVALILLDVQMPGMDGFETATHIKQRNRTQDIPIIFLTAYDAGTAEAMRGFSSGAVDFVTKPVDAVLLRAKVEVFVDLYQKTIALRRQSEWLGRRLDDRSEIEARHLRKLADAALVINSTLALDEILKVINDSARDIISAHHAEAFIMTDADADTVGPDVTRSYSQKYDAWASEGRPIDLSSIHGMVWERLEPVRMSKKEIEANLASHGVFGVPSGHPMLEGWLAVPVMGRTGRRLGVVQVSDKIDGEFTDSDEVVLVQLAQLAAVAIENAERFEQEHRIAETLQHSLLPEILPQLPGLELAARYVPGGLGTQVGGDWYDVFDLGPGRVALTVGDVVGRGPQAAAVMGQLRTAIRAYAMRNLAPAALMESLDRLLEGLNASTMATALYLVLDQEAGTVEMVSAGHPAPLLVEPGRPGSFVTMDPHPPLGVNLDAPWPSTTLAVEPGSLLVLYTDGLVEERGRSIEDGLRRLAKVVGNGAADIHALCDTILNRMGAQDKGDDVALLLARIGRQA
jgi:serine phosphatase RsbU (regulator of sigma subunit)/CheY-like chemotaxis protein